MKVCANCGKERPLDQFPVDKTGLYPDKVVPVCNVCLDERDADWRQLRENVEPIVNNVNRKEALEKALAEASEEYNAELKQINKNYQDLKDSIDERKTQELQRYNERVADLNAEYRDIKSTIEVTRKQAFETFNRELMQASADLRAKRAAIKDELKLL